MRPTLAAGILILAFHAAMAQAQSMPATATKDSEQTGSLKTVTLRRARTALEDRAQFISVTLLPGRGMDMFQATADLPGHGETPLIGSPSLEEAARRMNDPETDSWGYVSYGMGGAFLLPWASRMSGEVSPDHSTVSTDWHGHRLTERLNSGGKYAVHGLLHRTNIEDLKTRTTADGQTVTGLLHAGDFGGRWLSLTDVRFTISLTAAAVDLKIEATNVGHVQEPMAIGWHPYFALPSHDRSQARLHVAADLYAETVPSDGLTTGVLRPVAGSPFDFRKAEGAPLAAAPMNVNFSNLDRRGCVARLSDPASAYGLCIRLLSPAIHTIQVYSPSGASFVAIEPQFNFPDPFGQEWKGMDTGLVTLEPGQSAVWHVRLELFRP
jgi:galactose mutarotase-like enzyme